MEELKTKIHNLIIDRTQAIIDKYNRLTPSNMRLSLDQIEQCSRELIEDPIIIALNNQIFKIELHEIGGSIKYMEGKRNE